MINYVLPKFAYILLGVFVEVFEPSSRTLYIQFTFVLAALIFLANMLMILQTTTAKKAFVVTIVLNFGAIMFPSVNIVFLVIYVCAELPAVLPHLLKCEPSLFRCMFYSIPHMMLDYW